MSPRMKASRTTPPPRRGFTLVELMVVIVIISILVAIILPGVGAVRTNLRNAEVRTEISGLENAISQFVLEFGQEPPSYIVLYETKAGWDNDVQSRNIVRQLWPQFNFDARHNDSGGNALPGRDLNGNGNSNDTFILTGDECLVFFLGGVGTINANENPVANGFSKNPQDPFAMGGTRIGPFFEFDRARMIDYEPIIGSSDEDNTPGGVADGAYSYAHKFPASSIPYLYFSSYEGAGYRPQRDGNLNQSFDASGNPTIQAGELGAVYMQTDEIPWKEKSYQIISAGIDGEFGTAGLWSSEKGVGDGSATYKFDRDNVTNFSRGTLE